jgi:hypothetical protein
VVRIIRRWMLQARRTLAVSKPLPGSAAVVDLALPALVERWPAGVRQYVSTPSALVSPAGRRCNAG